MKYAGKSISSAVLVFIFAAAVMVSSGWTDDEVAVGGATVGGSSGGYDANPANPANWEWDFIIFLDGATTYDIWVYVNNVPTKQVWQKQWGANYWTVDGVPQDPGLEPLCASSIYVAESETITATSSGTFVRSMKWISPYQAPSQVLVKVTGSAMHARSDGGQVSSSTMNWIASPLEDAEWAQLTIGKQSTEQAAYIALPLENGVATIEAEQTATVTLSGPGVEAIAGANDFTVTLAETAIGVAPWEGLTYHKDDVTWLQVPNPNEYLTPRVMDTAVEYHDVQGAPHWSLDAAFWKEAWGTWTDPFNHWWANGDEWTDGMFTEYDSISTHFDFAIAGQFPTTEVVQLSVTNNGPPWGTRTGNLLMRVHLPAENVIVTSDVQVPSTWVRVTPKYILNPGDPPLPISQTVTWSHSYTSQMSTTVGASLGVEVAVKAQLSSSMTVALGETAQISVAHTVTHTFPSGSVAKAWWIERQTWYRHAEGQFDYYASDGYQGVEGLSVNYFESGTKANAEQLDYYERANWEYI